MRMQLKPAMASGTPNLRRALKLAAAGLLASSTGRAEAAPPEPPNTNVDSGVLYYQELGRVQAIEPELNVS